MDLLVQTDSTGCYPCRAASRRVFAMFEIRVCDIFTESGERLLGLSIDVQDERCR